MSDAVHFADAFNFYMFDGEQKIKPEQLKPYQTSDAALPHSVGGNAVPTQRHRDIMKELTTVMTDGQAAYALLGIENQANVHYAMPVRNMVYDALAYSSQVSAAESGHRKSDESAPSGAEWLSGWYKTDRLKPVFTLVLYFGAEPWDGPTALSEMLGTYDEEFTPYLQDYKIFVIAPKTIADEDFDKFHSDLRELLKFIKYSKDKAGLERMVSEDERFHHVSRMTADAINIITGSNMSFDDREEEIDMCKAVQDIRSEARILALAEEAVRSIKSIMETLNLTFDQAYAALKLPEDQKDAYREMVEAAQQ